MATDPVEPAAAVMQKAEALLVERRKKAVSR